MDCYELSGKRLNILTFLILVPLESYKVNQVLRGVFSNESVVAVYIIGIGKHIPHIWKKKNKGKETLHTVGLFSTHFAGSVLYLSTLMYQVSLEEFRVWLESLDILCRSG